MSNRKVFSRYTTLCGIPLLSKECGVRLDGFTIPKLDSSYFLLTAKDIPGVNKIKTFSSSFPLLAEGYISYIGEPLLVLFGPDYESVSLTLEKIVVHTSEIKEKEALKNNTSPLIYEDIKEHEEEKELKKIKMDLTFKGISFYSPFSYKALCAFSDDKLYIECPTQCQDIVKNSIFKVALINKKNITLINKDYTFLHDECLFTSVFSSVVCAIASKKTLLPCEIKYKNKEEFNSVHFLSIISLNEKNEVIKEETKTSIDGGAFNIWQDEILRSFLVSTMPLYNLKEFSFSGECKESCSTPLSFCGILPFELGSVFNAMRVNVLAKERNEMPSKTILELCKKNKEENSILLSYESDDLEKRITNIVYASDYIRKYSSFSQKKRSFGLFNKLEGIGISYERGRAGISKTGMKKQQYKTKIVLRENGVLSIIGPIPPRIREEVLPIDYFSSILTINNKKPTIIFLDNNGESSPSPDILHVYETQFTNECIKAIKRIKKKVEEKYKYPIEESFSLCDKDGCEYTESGDGIAVCESYIDKLTLSIYVKALYFDLVLNTRNTVKEKNKIRSSVFRVLKVLNIKTDPYFKINIKIKSENKDEKMFSSGESIAQALTLSSFLSSLSLALGNENNFSFPLKSDDIYQILEERQNEN